jgi:cysteinyl-tRNA synthetase
VFDLVREANAAMDGNRVGVAGREALLDLLADVDAHLALLKEEEVELDAEVERLIAERETARSGRDFTRADRLRDELRQRGVALEDTPEGVRWRVIRK